jgi:hypothetical protein
MHRALMAIVFMSSISSAAFAEVVEVYRWKVYPGKDVETLALFERSAAIHNGMGISVQINRLNIGTTQQLDYVMRYDDVASWGQLKDEASTSADFLELYAEYVANPPAELVESIRGTNLDPTIMAADFGDEPVFAVYIWEPDRGTTPQLIAGFKGSETLHESYGARIEGYQESYGGTTKMHYVMFFESWSALAAFESNEDMVQFANSLNSNPDTTSTLVSSFTGTTIATYK